MPTSFRNTTEPKHSVTAKSSKPYHLFTVALFHPKGWRSDISFYGSVMVSGSLPVPATLLGTNTAAQLGTKTPLVSSHLQLWPRVSMQSEALSSQQALKCLLTALTALSSLWLRLGCGQRPSLCLLFCLWAVPTVSRAQEHKRILWHEVRKLNNIAWRSTSF